jgi:hypothetical protein
LVSRTLVKRRSIRYIVEKCVSIYSLERKLLKKDYTLKLRLNSQMSIEPAYRTSTNCN